MSGMITDAGLLAIMSGSEPSSLSNLGIEQLYMTCLAWNQETDGTTQVWASTNDEGRIVRMDIFDSEIDLGDLSQLQTVYCDFFNTAWLQGHLVVSLLEQNTAIDIDYEVPGELDDPEVRQRLAASAAAQSERSDLHASMAKYIVQVLDY